MQNCALCNAPLSPANKPKFGKGKLNDGNQLCAECFSKLNKKNSPPVPKIRDMSTEDIRKFHAYQDQQKQELIDRISAIKSQVASLDLDKNSSHLGRKEISELHNILFSNETILDIVQGKYEKKIGILVATDGRLIFIDKGLFRLKVEDFPYDKITSIQFETGFSHGRLIILASGNKAQIDDVIKTRIKPFAEKVRLRIAELEKKQTASAKTVIVNHPIDIADQILKLANLRDMGILTGDEFQSQKLKLLNQ